MNLLQIVNRGKLILDTPGFEKEDVLPDVGTMNSIRPIVTSMIIAMIAGCVCSSAGETNSFRTLSKGAFSGIHSAIQEVIKSQSEWEEKWNQHTTRNSTKEKEKLPSVDFNKEMVVAVTLGKRKSGGHAVEVIQIAASEKKLLVTLKITSPKPGSMAIQSLTAPYHFVATPISDLEPKFIVSNGLQEKH